MDPATPAALNTLELTTLRQVPRETAASSLRQRSDTPASRGCSRWATCGASARAFMDDTGFTCGSPLLGRLTRDDEQLARALAAHERKEMLSWLMIVELRSDAALSIVSARIPSCDGKALWRKYLQVDG